MKISGIYGIVNTITGDCYIGSSIDLERRKREHFNENTWKHNPNKQLYKDMKQYGKENFLFKIIQLCDPEELKKYEQIAISIIQSMLILERLENSIKNSIINNIVKNTLIVSNNIIISNVYMKMNY